MSTSRFVVDHIGLTTTKPFDHVRAAFERQLGRFDADAYRSLAAGENAETVRARIEAKAGPSGFMVFATHDHGALLRIVGLMRPCVNPVRCGMTRQVEYLDNPLPNRLALKNFFHWHAFNVASAPCNRRMTVRNSSI